MKVQSLRSAALPSLALSLICSSACAQSNVTLYGILDIGMSHASDVGGGSQNLVDSGVMQGSRLGFKGAEDLGGGLSALFVLEQGLVLNSGALGQGGLVFGRQSWVGLSDRSLGTLSLGRQYDFMWDSLVPFTNATLLGGGYVNNPLDNDRTAGQRLNNSIKYTSPKWSGFSFGAMFAPSQTPGTSQGSSPSRSVGANYTQGNLSLGTAYTQVDGATLNVQSLVGSSQAYTLGGKRNSVAGMGGSYRLNEQFLLHGMVTRSEFEGNTSSANGTFKNYFGGVVYQPTSFWKLGVDLNNTKLLNASYKQVALTADYRLSKRTDVYAQVVTQRADGAANAKANIFILGGASGRDQSVVRFGLRHSF